MAYLGSNPRGPHQMQASYEAELRDLWTLVSPRSTTRPCWLHRPGTPSLTDAFSEGALHGGSFFGTCNKGHAAVE